MAKMKLDLKKFDLSALKGFLLAKGEKLILAVSLAIGAFLVINGYLAAAKAGLSKNGQQFLKVIEDGKNRIENQIRNASGTIEAVVIPDSRDGWRERLSTFPYSGLMSVSESGDFKRRNPVIVAVPENDDTHTNIQVEYVAGPALGYEVDRQNEKITIILQGGGGGGGGGPKKGEKSTGPGALPAQIVRPTRMIVTLAAFPMKDQLQQYSKALRLPVGDLISQGSDMPNFLGLNIIRVETDRAGANPVETKLYHYDAKADKVYVAEAIDNFFRATIVDEEGLTLLEDYRQANLMTPVPRMAGVTYPPVKLDTIKTEMAKGDDDDEKAGPNKEKPMKKGPGAGGVFGMPKAMGGGQQKAAGGQPNSAPKADLGTAAWKKLDETLQAKLRGNALPFDPTGAVASEAKETKTGKAPMNPMPSVRAPVKPMAPMNPMNIKKQGENPRVTNAADADPSLALINEIKDAAIRFVDIDVEPGKTYHYKFQVRVQNPNYNRKGSDLAAQALADVKELTSPWTKTPAVTVPTELFVYAVDQKDTDPPRETRDSRDVVVMPTSKKPTYRGPDSGPLDEGSSGVAARAPIQIHRWIAKAVDTKEGTEYLIGDWVIAERLLVRRGESLGRRNVYLEVPTWSKARGDWELLNTAPPAKKGKEAKGISLDFSLGNPPTVLIDFEGGPRSYQSPRSGMLKEDSALELLILTPEGKLVVRNSGEDSEDVKRLERYKTFRDRVIELTPEPQNNNGPNGPTGPLNPFKGFGK